MLNKSKVLLCGLHVFKVTDAFAEEWRLMLEGTPNLDFIKKWLSGLI
jgi:hypothetical protein